MKIKVELSDEEIKRFGFKTAMNLKWQLEDRLLYLSHCDEEAEELLDEIQKKN